MREFLVFVSFFFCFFLDLGCSRLMQCGYREEAVGFHQGDSLFFLLLLPFFSLLKDEPQKVENGAIGE